MFLFAACPGEDNQVACVGLARRVQIQPMCWKAPSNAKRTEGKGVQLQAQMS